MIRGLPVAGSLDLRAKAMALLRQSSSDEADLLSRAAATIEADETDLELAKALIVCAKKVEQHDPVVGRHMRDAALRLILIG
jgi:hypothetical protein